jgi:predicted ester cyclase
MTTTPRALVIALLDAYDADDLERFRDLVTDDFVDHGLPPGVVPPGPDGYIATLAWVKREMQVRYEVHDVIEAGEYVTVRATAHGVHRTGTLGVPATGLPYAMATMHLYRAEGDRLAEHWGVRDEWSVLVQVGALVPELPELVL